jgi:hypothetical protein
LNNNRTGHTTHCVNSGMLGPFRSVASKHQHKHNLPVFRSCLLSYSLRRNQRVLRINVLFLKLESFFDRNLIPYQRTVSDMFFLSR